MNKEKDLQKIKALATGEQCNIFWFDEGGGVVYKFYDVEQINDAIMTAEFIGCIGEYIEQYGFDLCDELLDVVDLERLHPVLMVALIRTTFSFRHELNNWVSCRDKISALLYELGYDSAGVLRGLY
jgi:hypothetical protein